MRNISEKDKLRVIELFSGIGAQTEALKRLGIPHEVVAWADIDPNAEKAYKLLQNPMVENSGDMYKIESLPECDLLVYSSPCQSFSLAGKREGAEEGSGTYSAVIWEVIRLLDDFKERGCLPECLLLENVKGLITEKFMPFFKQWLERLKKDYGYNNYYKCQNAKGFNVPQNRERVMVVSIRNDVDNGYLEFPDERPCKVKLKDVLEKEVDERFYLSQRAIDGIMHSSYNVTKKRIQVSESSCRTLAARDYKDPKVVFDNHPIHLGDLQGEPWNKMFEQSRRFYSEDGISPAQVGNGGGHRETKVGIEIDAPVCFAMRGRNPENPSDRATGSPTEQRLEMNSQGTTNTLTTVGKDNLIGEPQMLTPKRTEYGKAMRKAYESGEHKESRHGMTEFEVRTDGIGNCLSTVPKDTMVAEEHEIESPTILAPNNFGHKAGDGSVTRERIEKDIVPALQAQEGSTQRSYVKEPILSQRAHGYNAGYLEQREVVPPLTSHGYQDNNHIHEPIEVKDGTLYNPYNRAEITDIAPTQTANCGSSTSSATVAKFEEVEHPDDYNWENYADELDMRIDPDEDDDVDDRSEGKKPGFYFKDGKYYKVRKLTPRESFRLMGWQDERIEPILTKVDARGKRLVSDSACYFLCGNSIVIQHLMAIFGQLYRVKWKKKVFGTDENPEAFQFSLLDFVKPSEELYENWAELDPIKE